MQDLPPLDPDSVTVGQLSPQRGLRRVDTGPTRPPQGGNDGNPSSATSSNQGGTISGVSGIEGIQGLGGGLVSQGLGLSPLGQVPGAVAGINAAIQGQSIDAIQDAVLGGLLGWGGATVASNIGLGYGTPGVVGAVMSELTKDNPNLSAAALGSTAQIGSSMLGGMVAGPVGALIGGTIGGNLAQSSLRDGYLGDLADSRTKESMRDAVEDAFGVTPGQTADMAKVDSIEGYLNDLSDRLSSVTGKESTHDLDMTSNIGFGDFGFSLDSFAESADLTGKLGGLESVEKDMFGEIEGFMSLSPELRDLMSEDSTTSRGTPSVSSGNVSTLDGLPASVGYTDGSPISGTGPASVSNPGSTEDGLNSDTGRGGGESSGTDGGYGDPDAGGEGMI